MRTVASDVEQWIAEGATSLALATTARTWGSAPLPAGSTMAVAPDGRFSGSVSGGCVEAAVIKAAADVLAGGPSRMLTFAVGDETAWSVGLACGGELAVWLERWSVPAWRQLMVRLDASPPTSLVRVIDGAVGTVGRRYVVAFDGDLGLGTFDASATRTSASVAAANIDRIADANGDAAAAEPDANDASVGGWAAATAADQAHAVADTATRHTWPIAGDSTLELFTVSLAAPPPVIIVGAGAIAVALAQLAALVEMPVIVIDPRRTFVTAGRFPDAQSVLHAWPDKAFQRQPIPDGAAVVVLSHDPKVDDPALHAALRSQAAYIGALGGRASQARRRERLLAQGFTPSEVQRVRGPVGVPIGAQTPAEIALSIMAEIVATRRQAGA